MQLAVAQANLGGRSHDLKGNMLGLVGEQTNAATSCRASHVLLTFQFVGGCGIGKNPVGHVVHRVLQTEPPAGVRNSFKLLFFPVLLEPKAPAGPRKVDAGDGNIWGHRNFAGRKQNFFPVNCHMKGPIGKTGVRTNGAGALQATRVDNGNYNGVLKAFTVRRDNGKPGNVGNLRNGRDRRRNPHVEVYVGKVRDQSVPLIVFTRKVELLAAETRHVRVT